MAAMFLPLSVLAAVSPSPNAGANNTFCSRINTVSTRVEQRIVDRQARITKSENDREAKLAERFADRLTRVAKNRAETDAKRAEKIALLESKASTDAQKVAVTVFKTALNNAIAARRTAINAAMKVFQDGVKQAVESRKNSVEALVANFKASAEAALQKAKNSCAAGTDSKTVRQTYLNDMKAARDAFQNGKQSLDKIGDEISNLAKVRNQAVQAAADAFKTAVEQARQQLKTAFGEK
ncbi:MAG: Uncharacterized protein CEN90_186 [Parcubacteria group bacterium Licking1014_17]|nr:MAG: Uncharacterized protein CEN90_186 [Parcubacteria group bacterium Licking1014_17]